MAKAFAEAKNCDIVLANDPDADRLAVAEKDQSTGIWTIFSGDQIGTMLGLWIWEKIGKGSDKVGFRERVSLLEMHRMAAFVFICDLFYSRLLSLPFSLPRVLRCYVVLRLLQPVSMCTSTVSSKMLAGIGKREGFHVEESLAGFKWIGSRSAALQAEGYRHLFGYEEAIGFAW